MRFRPFPGGRTELVASGLLALGIGGLALVDGSLLGAAVGVLGVAGALGLRRWTTRPPIAAPAVPAVVALAWLVDLALGSDLGKIASVLAGLAFLYWLLSTDLPIPPAFAGDGEAPSAAAREAGATVVLAIGLFALAALSGSAVGVAIAAGGVGTSFVLRRWKRGPGLEFAGIPALLALALLAASVAPTPAAELVAGLSGLAFLFWLGVSGPTGASWLGRIGALVLPGLALGIAIATSLALPGVPTGEGVGIATALVVGTLLLAALALGRPATWAPPS